MNIKKALSGFATAGASLAVVLMPLSVAAADSTVVVTGNTVDESLGENGSQGWWFNRDAANATPYEFNQDQASIGEGSLYVEPISGATPAHKFIAENFAQAPVSELNSISYDYMIDGTGTVADVSDFYVNVYANIDNSSKFYDCRYDYVETTGVLGPFNTANIDATDTPTNVATSGSTRVPGGTCPATLAGMPAGSHVRMFSINVGQTNASDAGLAAYLDNVIVNTDTDVTTYDFEAAPVVNGENFNTHSGTDYKGVNVGYNVDYFDEITSTEVKLLDADDNVLVTNIGTQDLFDLYNDGVTKQFSTPFITENGTYDLSDPYWVFGEWNSFAKPVTAVITVNGVVAEITPLTEPNGIEWEDVAPPAPTDKESCKNGGWVGYYSNQGQCVSSFASNGRSNGNPVVSFFRNLF